MHTVTMDWVHSCIGKTILQNCGNKNLVPIRCSSGFKKVDEGLQGFCCNHLPPPFALHTRTRAHACAQMHTQARAHTHTHTYTHTSPRRSTEVWFLSLCFLLRGHGIEQIPPDWVWLSGVFPNSAWSKFLFYPWFSSGRKKQYIWQADGCDF